MSVVSKLLGVAMSALGLFIFWWGWGTSGQLVWSFVGMFVMAMGFTLLTAGRQQKEEKPPPPTVTEIRCGSCDFKEIRDFQKGDYVLQTVEATCPKCQGSMTIEGVYIVREDSEDKDKI